MSYHERTANAAKGKWRGILMELGVPEASLTGKHSPCPLCNSRDNFRWDNKEGSGSFICTCGAGAGMKLAMDFTGLPFPDVASRIDTMLGNIKPDETRTKPEISEEDRRRLLREVYQGSQEIEPGDIAHRYLASRHIEELIYPKALRFHPKLRDGEGGIRPALIAMIGVPGAERFCSMHRTFLNPDGSGKAEMERPRKLMAGALPDGACVMLSEYHGGPLGIAEGIETAMSASAMFDMPVWAAISSSMLAKWSPPEGCEEVAVFIDRDPKFGGQAAGFGLAHRLSAKFTVTAHMPDRVGEDFADVYLRTKGVFA